MHPVASDDDIVFNGAVQEGIRQAVDSDRKTIDARAELGKPGSEMGIREEQKGIAGLRIGRATEIPFVKTISRGIQLQRHLREFITGDRSLVFHIDGFSLNANRPLLSTDK
ncbi:hypothetical protein LMA00_12665 [Burkholderia ambifaria]|uniref:hypothetical protein n=1 Tax=Burkholderia ambifaria TaxID=152480 RepID=UPI001E55B148|nr:hypothetical protein [Burkholderia ambifaria]UEP47496.1 hypothetical protein LMA00_12665 [Burkholderia ambifaria]